MANKYSQQINKNKIAEMFFRQQKYLKNYACWFFKKSQIINAKRSWSISNGWLQSNAKQRHLYVSHDYAYQSYTNMLSKQEITVGYFFYSR
jgi:hypothetical protein